MVVERSGSLANQMQLDYAGNHNDLLYYYSTEFEHESLLSNYSLGMMLNDGVYTPHQAHQPLLTSPRTSSSSST